jgi:hypothetical protein
MNDGAVLAQWLHTYEIDAATLASIFRAIEATFPDFAIYATNDADLVVVARKGGKPLVFDPVVMGWPGLAPFLEKTRLSDADSVRRRSFGYWRGLAPIYASHTVAANSDFFPVVDQRASKTRYLHVRADELVGLLRSPMPMLEMLAGSTMATAGRNDALAVAVIDRVSSTAWQVHDLAMSGAAVPKALDSREEFAGWMSRRWSQCESGLTFTQALPLLLGVAEAVNPFVPPETANALWAKVADSPCGRKLAPQERRWLDLFSAVARRDAPAMASVGSEVLAGLPKEPPGAVSEYALLAAVLGNVCQGDSARAQALIQEGLGKWVRRGSRVQETLFLDALSQPGRRGPPPACAAR